MGRPALSQQRGESVCTSLGTRVLRPITGPLSPQKRFPSKKAMTGSENQEAREEAKGRESV